ncbi:MAG: alpha/beta hydrolase [Ilumatobacteraceae bacterium]
MSSAKIGTTTIEYEVIGEGQPLMLVMGLSCQLIHWPDEFVQLLVDRGFRVIRFDNRDIGLSTKFGGPPPTIARTIGSLFSKRLARSSYKLADMANDAAGLLDHLGIDKAHVVGVSMGGMIAQSIAIGHPNKVASLTSIMSNTGDRKNGRISIGLMKKMPKYLKSTPETRFSNAIAVDRLISGAVFDESATGDIIRRAIARDADELGTARQTAAISASPDRTAGLNKVTAPTLVIHGLMDPLVLPSGGMATARAVPGSRLLMFPDMGHDLPVSRWPEIVDAINANAARAPINQPAINQPAVGASAN